MLAMNDQSLLHQDHRYLVVGLGLTGYSVARYLLANGYRCAVQDDRQEPPYRASLVERFADVELHQQALKDINLDAYDCLVVSPGLSIRSPVLEQQSKAGKRIIGDIELFAEAVDKPVIAITGSNGKSTVTTLVGEMIREDGYQVGVGGNIGVPALELLDQPADFYVLELSSFQLETTSSLKPLCACILNVSEDHMDRYDDLDDYRNSKQRIYRNAMFCISNQDDELSWNDESDERFSTEADSAYRLLNNDGHIQLATGDDTLIDVNQLKLRGRHNWSNALAAIALADKAGISHQAMRNALTMFTGLPHRSQWVAEINGVHWINDSKATNPGATVAAIEGLGAPLILIAGGIGKGADMSTLREPLRRQVKKVFLFGQDGEVMAEAWQDCCPVECIDNLDQAVSAAAKVAVDGDQVLLAPACASFDQYSGFEQRGEHFVELVEALK